MGDPHVVKPGGVVPHDPDAQNVIRFDWTGNLPALAAPVSGVLQPNVPVSIVSSIWNLVGLDQALTLDTPAIVSASVTAIRISGGTIGRTYQLTNRVGFNVQPQRVADASVSIVVEQA
jgi:hypothetical protein